MKMMGEINGLTELLTSTLALLSLLAGILGFTAVPLGGIVRLSILRYPY